MRCSSCEPLLDRYIEGTLTPREMVRVGEHLSRCARCESLHAELRVVDALLATGRPVDLAPNFTFAVMAEARSLPVTDVKRRPLWPVFTAYIVVAWIAVAGFFAAFGFHASALDALLGSAFAQLRAVIDVAAHGFGRLSPSLLGGVIVILALDAVFATVALSFYRRARSRALRSEAP